MNFNKILNTFLIVMGCVVFTGWMFVDIFGEEKLNPVFAAIGLIVSFAGINENNHLEIMNRLDERK